MGRRNRAKKPNGVQTKPTTQLDGVQVSTEKNSTNRWRIAGEILTLLIAFGALLLSYRANQISERSVKKSDEAISVADRANSIAIDANTIAKKSAPDYYAAPHELSYWFTEINTREFKGNLPQGVLFLTIENQGATPARDIRATIEMNGMEADIKCEQKLDVWDGPDGKKVLTVDRIPPRSFVKVMVMNQIKTFPQRSHYSPFPGASHLKHQYSPIVFSVQTEYGQIAANLNRCGRDLELLESDGGGNLRQISDADLKLIQATLKSYGVQTE